MCKPFCPAGYQIVFGRVSFGESEVDDMLQKPRKTVKRKNLVRSYPRSKKGKKFVKPKDLSECPPYECVPLEENGTECGPPVCPPDHSVTTLDITITTTLV